jgi:hypothetical protein
LIQYYNQSLPWQHIYLNKLNLHFWF